VYEGYGPYVERMLTHFWELNGGNNEDANDVKIPTVAKVPKNVLKQQVAG